MPEQTMVHCQASCPSLNGTVEWQGAYHTGNYPEGNYPTKKIKYAPIAHV